jgi:hypothetical protein
MSSDTTRRELLVTLTATPASGPAQRLGPERQLLAEAGILDQDTGRWKTDFSTLDQDALRRLELLLQAARQHGTTLTLDVRIAPNHWRGPTLPWPLPQPAGVADRPHGSIDPSAVHTLLLIDVQHLPGGPTHHWWLSAEPPTGTHPDLHAACRVLRDFADDEDPFAPFTGASAQVWGGPGHATIRGFWRGRWHQSEFHKSDAGQTHRWNQLGAILQPNHTQPAH